MRRVLGLALALGAGVLSPGPALAADDAAVQAPAPGMAVVQGTLRLTSASVLGESEVKARDALVYLEGPVAGRWKERRGELPRMIQRDKAFQPGLLVVRLGQTVVFPNEDVVFHNVFSLTDGNQFDLGVYAQGQTKAVRFQKAGVVDVFCNIHPQMIGAIVVVENPFHAELGEDGRFRLEVPPGKHTVVAYWTRGVREERPVELAAGEVLDLDFALRDTGQKVRHLDKNGQSYGRYK